jgi:hypothetical protein
MAAVVLIGLFSVGLAVLLAALLPGAGFIGAIIVLVLGGAVIAWFLLARASRQSPSDVARRSEEKPDLLGPVRAGRSDRQALSLTEAPHPPGASRPRALQEKAGEHAALPDGGLAKTQGSNQLRSLGAVAPHFREDFCSLVDAPDSFRQTVSGGP